MIQGVLQLVWKNVKTTSSIMRVDHEIKHMVSIYKVKNLIEFTCFAIKYDKLVGAGTHKILFG